MNKNNRKVFGYVSEYGDESITTQCGYLASCDEVLFKLPVIGESIRKGDTLKVDQIKVLGMTIKQSVEYLVELNSNGIDLESLTESWFNTDLIGNDVVYEALKSIREANKSSLSRKSKEIKGSGAKMGSYNKEVNAAIVGMYVVTQNVSAIATALNVSRNTVYKSLNRNKLK